MKKLFIVFALLMGIGITPGFAQVSLQVNLGLQPLWGPIGYDHVDYYYIPDVDAYYSVSGRTYTYMDGGQWITESYLPSRYSNFDLYSAHKIVVNEANPWRRNDYYHRQYAGYRGRHDQMAIRDSRDNRYYANPNHPHHNEWHGNGGPARQQQGAPRQDNGHHDNGRPQEQHGNGRPQEQHNNGRPQEQHGNGRPQEQHDNGHQQEQHGNGGQEEHHDNGGHEGHDHK